MQGDSALGRALVLVRTLRAGCAWDRAQTPQTLRPYLVEEVMELDQAIRVGDPIALRDELGEQWLRGGRVQAEEHTVSVVVLLLLEQVVAPTVRGPWTCGPGHMVSRWPRSRGRFPVEGRRRVQD